MMSLTGDVPSINQSRQVATSHIATPTIAIVQRIIYQHAWFGLARVDVIRSSAVAYADWNKQAPGLYPRASSTLSNAVMHAQTVGVTAHQFQGLLQHPGLLAVTAVLDASVSSIPQTEYLNPQSPLGVAVRTVHGSLYMTRCAMGLGLTLDTQVHSSHPAIFGAAVDASK